VAAVEAGVFADFADFPFFEATVFFGEFVDAVWGFFAAVFDVGVLDVVFDCGRASEPASIESKKSVRPYFMSNKKGRCYRSKPAPCLFYVIDRVRIIDPGFY